MAEQFPEAYASRFSQPAQATTPHHLQMLAVPHSGRWSMTWDCPIDYWITDKNIICGSGTYLINCAPNYAACVSYVGLGPISSTVRLIMLHATAGISEKG